MLADLQLCGAKPRTQETYLRKAENLAKHFNRSPAELGENELKEYLLYLMMNYFFELILLRHIILTSCEGCDIQPSWKKETYFSG
jgi:hypothetical protein